MSKTYTFEIISVNTATNSMEVKFSAEGEEPILVGTRMPAATENLSDMLVAYIPHSSAGFQSAPALMDVSVGQVGVVTLSAPMSAQEVEQQRANEKMWLEVSFDKSVAASLVRLGVLTEDPMEIPTATL